MCSEVNRVAANLIIHELIPRLKSAGIPIEKSPISPMDIRVLALCKRGGLFTTHEIRRLMSERIEKEGERSANPVE